MTFGIAARIAAAAVQVLPQLQNNVSARGLRPVVMGNGVRDVDVASLGLGTAHLIGLLHVEVETKIVDRQHRDHGVAEREVRMQEAPVLVADNTMLAEAEGLAQPFDGGERVAIAHGRYQRRSRYVHGIPHQKGRTTNLQDPASGNPHAYYAYVPS